VSYLDQLKQQATALEQEKKAAGKSDAQLKQAYDEQVRPSLERAFQYFHEVTQQLAAIKPKTPVNYELEGVGPLLNLFQDEYILSSYQKNDDSFFVRIFSHGELKQRFEVKSADKLEEYKNYLWKHNIKFKYRQVNDARSQFLRAVFEIQGEIVAQINFKGHYDTSSIEIHTQNFPVLGNQTYLYPAHKFNEAFLDKLAMYITRDSTDNILKVYKLNQVWAGKPLNAKQLQREEILAKLRKSETSEKKTATTPNKAATNKPATTKAKPAEAEKKSGFFSSLFGKK
jgi:hypothetical protein